MKKRFVTTLIAFVACLACALGLVACDDADPVAGKAYEFEKTTIESGAEGAVKETAESSLNELYEGSTLSFDNEGNYTLTIMNTPVKGTYSQSGSKITLTYNGSSQDVSVSGENIVMKMEKDGIKANLIYKPVTQNSDEQGGNEQGGNEQGGNEQGGNEQGGNEQGGNEQGGASRDVLAGKTYKLTEYLMNGISIKDEMLAQMGEMKIVFGQDGTLTMLTLNDGSVNGTYTINGTTATLTIEGDPQDFVIEGNTITATMTTEDNQGTPITMVMKFTLQA